MASESELTHSGTVFRFGSMEIHCVTETLGPAFSPMRLFPTLRPEIIDRNLEWLAPEHYCIARKRLVMGTHSWVIRTERHTVVVDTCVGNHKYRPNSPGFDGLNTGWLNRLEKIGVEPEDVDYVLCTHLHADHVGWNTRLDNGQWVPTFPRATMICSTQELEAARRTASDDRDWAMRLDTDEANVWLDSILPLHQAGLLRTVDGRSEIVSGIYIEPAPGHTIGNTVVWIESKNEAALVGGDVCHHPLQVYHPELYSCFCENPEEARLTRLRLLTECAKRKALLMPAHWGAPFAGMILPDPNGFSIAWR